MDATERSIFEQFEFWNSAPTPALFAQSMVEYVVVGCGSSYNLAMSVAAFLNEKGFGAIAVPGNEWVRRPHSYKTHTRHTHVIAISRSGETTELIEAARRSRADGLPVTAITCDASSALVANADHVMTAATHPEEGIVMTASASLMLILALRFAGIDTAPALPAARALLTEFNRHDGAFLEGRTHFVFLGGGVLHGIAAEGALKLEEMSLTATETYFPLEYRHGPVSVVDRQTLVVMLYHPDTRDEEQRLAAELSAMGAFVIGFGGAGDLSLDAAGPADLRGLVCLPALQLLGAQLARLRGVDTSAPRHLTKVVRIA